MLHDVLFVCVIYNICLSFISGIIVGTLEMGPLNESLRDLLEGIQVITRNLWLIHQLHKGLDSLFGV